VAPENEVLVESYRLIHRYVYRGGKIWKNIIIQKRVKWLYHRYGMTRQDIIEYVKWKYRAQQKHRKFDPGKSCLETYVLNFTYFTLTSLVRRFRKYDAASKKEIPLSQLQDIDPIVSMGNSIRSLERTDIDGLIYQENPEDILIASELIALARDYIGDDDLAVIIGLKKREDEAERLGVEYDTYRKRLQRKLSKFKDILNDAGYDLN
jgi:hypothetical protein